MGGDISRENGKKGGRPIAEATMISRIIKDKLAKKALEQFNAIVDPQFKKAKKGVFESYKDIMDRVGVKADEAPTTAIQVNINEDRSEFS